MALTDFGVQVIIYASFCALYTQQQIFCGEEFAKTILGCKEKPISVIVLSQLMFRANKIVILGCSFTVADNYFCDILRENSDAQIVIIDKDMDTVSRHVCDILQLPPNRYSRQMVNGKERRKYNNRVTIVEADLADVNLDEYMK